MSYFNVPIWLKNEWLEFKDIRAEQKEWNKYIRENNLRWYAFKAMFRCKPFLKTIGLTIFYIILFFIIINLFPRT